MNLPAIIVAELHQWLLLAAFAVGVLLLVAGVVATIHFTFRWTQGLPDWQAAAIRAFVLALVFTPGGIGGESGGSGFILPCPALLSVIAMIFVPDLNAGWICGIVPMIVAWPLLWSILWSKATSRRKQALSTPAPATRKPTAKPAAESAVSPQMARALLINRLWFVGGLAVTFLGFAMLFGPIIVEARSFSPALMALGGFMIIPGWMAWGMSLGTRSHIRSYGRIAQQSGGTLSASWFLGDPSLIYDHRGTSCTVRESCLSCPWSDHDFRIYIYLTNERAVKKLHAQVRHVDDAGAFSTAPRSSDVRRLVRLLRWRRFVEALEQIARFRDNSLTTGVTLQVKKGQLRITKPVSSRRTTADLTSMQDFAAMALAVCDCLLDEQLARKA